MCNWWRLVYIFHSCSQKTQPSKISTFDWYECPKVFPWNLPRPPSPLLTQKTWSKFQQNFCTSGTFQVNKACKGKLI